MRIAMLGHKRIPSREGGVEIVVEELAIRMVRQGHHVTCYNRKGHHVSGKQYDNDKRKEYENITLKDVFTINAKGLAAMSSSFFAALDIAFSKYEVVHFHAEGPCAVLWIPKLFGKRCIATVHGLDHQRAKWGGFAKRYILFGEKVAVKYADEIIVLSENVRQYFLQTYNRETIYIPNGVNRPKKYDADMISTEYGLKKDGYILFLGRLVPEKGINYLIEAFKDVKTDKKLVIAGGSSDTEEFMNMLIDKSKSDDRVVFTGFVQGRMLEELYSNAYVYTLPSDLEGMPLSLLEAMSYGNCCLTSDINECTGVVEDKAMTFRKSDVEDLKQKLQLLCDNYDLVLRYKENASEYICNKFMWDNVVNETLKLYYENA